MSIETAPQEAMHYPPGGPAPTRTTFTLWRAGLWCGVAYMVLGLLFWAVIAKFCPPPHQSWEADRVKEFFLDQPRVMIGIVGYCFIAAFWVPMSVVLARIMSRIEGRDGILHWIEFFGGMGTAFVTLFSGVAWLAASYQPEQRAASDIELLNDLAWFIFNMTVMCTFLQYVAFGICILLDKRTEPLLPKGLAWLSFVVSASFLPICLMPFFPESPFAWDGLVTYWIALGLFFVWMPFAFVSAFTAIKRIEKEELG